MKNKSFIGRLLDNKKVVLLVSFLLAVMFWVISSDNTAETIYNVPVKYSFSEDAPSDLKVFGLNIDGVAVDVVGKRVVIDDLDSEDLTATIDLTSVTGYADASFPIYVRNNNSDFDIENVEPSSIRLVIDREVTKTVKLVTDFKYAVSGYYVDSDVPSTIEITGPETLISQVKCAYIGGTVDNSESAKVTNSYSVELYDSENGAKDGNKVSKEFISLSHSNVEVTFRFLKLDEEMPFEITYSPSEQDVPSNYFTITPKTISLAGPEEFITGSKAISGIKIDIGDLSGYKNELYNKTFPISDLLGDNFINKSEGVENVSVRIDFSSLKTTTIEVPASKVETKNKPDKIKYTTSSSYPVTVVGTKSVIENISVEDISVILDFSEVDADTTSEVLTVGTTINIEAKGLCWAYTPNNTATVQIDK